MGDASNVAQRVDEVRRAQSNGASDLCKSETLRKSLIRPLGAFAVGDSSEEQQFHLRWTNSVSTILDSSSVFGHQGFVQLVLNRTIKYECLDGAPNRVLCCSVSKSRDALINAQVNIERAFLCQTLSKNITQRPIQLLLSIIRSPRSQSD